MQKKTFANPRVYLSPTLSSILCLAMDAQRGQAQTMADALHAGSAKGSFAAEFALRMMAICLEDAARDFRHYKYMLHEANNKAAMAAAGVTGRR